jgi:hypothetical protein
MAFGLEPRDGIGGKSTRKPKRRKKRSDLGFDYDVKFTSPFGPRSPFAGTFRWMRR